ncbi:MAG: 50S ribosomal protein L15 [Candidatus Aminicenantia bacterium]
MNLHNLQPSKGAVKKRKRVGRGPGSGHGKTATRGMKGQKSITGFSQKKGFEGGQMPLHRRIPKRGFTNIFKKEWQILNIKDLAKLKHKEITLELLAQEGLIKDVNGLLKILGEGEIERAIVIHAHAFSKSAKEKIEKAGGKVVLLQ